MKQTGANEPFVEEDARDEKLAHRAEDELLDLDREYPWTNPAKSRRPGDNCIFCKPDLSTHQALALVYTVSA